MIKQFCSGLVLILLSILALHGSAQEFVAFESVQFRPLALSVNKRLLFAVNTPDNRLEIFDVSGDEPLIIDSVQVGLEPVAVAVLSATEVWVVNHLSDSVSVIELGRGQARVTRTLLVGDEPRDIVFGGAGGNRAFITAAHRGQNSPYNDTENPGEMTTPGIGRTDVWVFDTDNLGDRMGGTPLQVMALFGDTAGPLTISPDGKDVYVGVFKSGNKTTIVSELLVCNGGESAEPCQAIESEAVAPGGSPAPNVDSEGVPAPETGLIVREENGVWRDELGRDWSDQIRFDLPDYDVFRISEVNNEYAQTAAYSGVGTVLYGMSINPRTGQLYISNSEAKNEVRFTGTRPEGSTLSTVNGRLHLAQVTVVNPEINEVTPRHLNSHINYSTVPSPAETKSRSLSTPMGMVSSWDGAQLFVAAMGSNKIAVLDAKALENGELVPDSSSHITVTGGGPTGLALDDRRRRLYALTRYDNGVSVIDIAARAEIAHTLMPNPEPETVINGRPFLYDASLTSSNGEASCATCHVGGDKDEIAWDLGNPLGSQVENLNPFTFRPPPAPPATIHPMKGPMSTQTLRGMATHGPMHWRGDKSGAFDPDGDALDERAAFMQFNEAFVNLQGRDSELQEADMRAFTDFVLQILPPPNPIRNLDDSLTVAQAAGRVDFFEQPLNAFGATCSSCHALDPDAGFFGADGLSVFVGAPNTPAQADLKSPQLRNAYEKVGMFGQAGNDLVGTDNTEHTGDQIRGFGFMRDGGFDTLQRRINIAIFDTPGGEQQHRNIEQFIFAFDSDLKPVVGQQITLRHDSGAEANRRVDLLVSRADAGDADLVVSGRIDGTSRQWLRQDDNHFTPDNEVLEPSTEQALRALATVPGQELTYTAVPLGSGVRLALDRDRDSVLNGTDNCPSLPNPEQSDTDNNGVGNACQSATDRTVIGEAIDGETGSFFSSGGGGSVSVFSLLFLFLLAHCKPIGRSPSVACTTK
ncbi:MAG: YncE family protein [Pseudomonadales bacterium]